MNVDSGEGEQGEALPCGNPLLKHGWYCKNCGHFADDDTFPGATGLLIRALDELKVLTEGEACDHAVGICYCETFRLMDEIQKSIHAPSSTVAGAQPTDEDIMRHPVLAKAFVKSLDLELKEASADNVEATRQNERYSEVVAKIFAAAIVKNVPKEGAWDTRCPFCYAENVGDVRHKLGCMVPLAKKILSR